MRRTVAIPVTIHFTFEEGLVVVVVVVVLVVARIYLDLEWHFYYTLQQFIPGAIRNDFFQECPGLDEDGRIDYFIDETKRNETILMILIMIDQEKK
jgi:hypothetical protein